MPSENKTPNIGLNQWSGNEYPRRQDFVEDNLIIDEKLADKAEKVHTHTPLQVGLGNVPNVATNDQTPTYTESAAIEELSSGEKLSTAFGKLKAAVKGLIVHTGASNPHSGSVPTSRTVNGKALTGNIALNAGDVGAAASASGSWNVSATSGFTYSNMTSQGFYTRVGKLCYITLNITITAFKGNSDTFYFGNLPFPATFEDNNVNHQMMCYIEDDDNNPYINNKYIYAVCRAPNNPSRINVDLIADSGISYPLILNSGYTTPSLKIRLSGVYPTA